MSYSLSFLNDMKDRLEQELDLIHQDLSDVSAPDVGDHVAGQYAPKFTHSDEFAEDNAALADDLADHAVNVDVTLTLEEREEAITRALQTIEDGEYGVCAECSDDIGEERLKANPSAELCMLCAS